MKYAIEGNINFFDELYKSLDANESSAKTEIDDNLCLITNQLLTENFVKLDCAHKFNYEPLFHDILNHKQKYNQMESSQTALTPNEIRCPYCRTKQKGVLPYYEGLPFPKVNGVNHYNPHECHIALQNSHKYPKCEFLTEIINFNAETDEASNAPKFVKCHKYGAAIFGENYGDTKCYCHYHKMTVVKGYKKAIVLKAKEEKLKETIALKQKVKEEKEKAKEEKQKAKAELQKAKETANVKPKSKRKPTNKSSIENITNSIDSENVVLGNMVIDLDKEIELNVTLCNKILQSGINKGKQCSEKKFNNCLCRRHFNIADKKEKGKDN
jgi:hypothetical protein